jgi:ABC-type multidrug transport system ATPase subunit
MSKAVQHSLSFRDVNFIVKNKSGVCSLKTDTRTKTIISDISATISSGEVMAIMGPSGAGKTTLLNVLTLQAFGGRAVGEVLLDGQPLTMDEFKRSCAMCEQEDNLWSFLTTRQTLQSAADLCLKESKENRVRKVCELLDTLGLNSCADTKVGNPFMKGLSGGQKRRLSIALVMLKAPRVLFLDEPTSGLDAASTVGVMRAIKSLAVQKNLIVVCTIHQPSTTVYQLFDNVTILSQGRLAYTGLRVGAVPHFASIGFPLPPDTNPAEHMLTIVNADFAEDSNQVPKILDSWAATAATMCASDQASTVQGLTQSHPSSTSFTQQTLALFRRHLRLSIVDPTLYLGRMVFFLMCCVFFGAIYIKARDYHQDHAVSRVFLWMWVVAVPTMMCVVIVYACNEEFKVIRKETRNGFLSPAAYLIARTGIEIPMVLLLSVFALGVGGFGMMQFNPSAFFLIIAVWASMLWSFECTAQVFSVLFSNPLVGMMMFVMYWFASFVFAGMFVPEADIIWPFRALVYTMPLKYSLQSLIYLDFHDSTFTCGGTGHLSLDGTPCTQDRTGAEVLGYIGQNVINTASASDTVGQDIGILLSIGAVYKLAYFVLLWAKANKMSQIHHTTGAPTTQKPNAIGAAKNNGLGMEMEQP